MALKQTPFLESELPQLRFELVLKNKIIPSFENNLLGGSLVSKRKRDIKEYGKLNSDRLAELKIHVIDWKAKDFNS